MPDHPTWTLRVYYDDAGEKRCEIENPDGDVVAEHRTWRHPDHRQDPDDVEHIGTPLVTDAMIDQYFESTPPRSNAFTPEARDAIVGLAMPTRMIDEERVKLEDCRHAEGGA